MRIDHHAYRKATGVAGFGFLLQAAVTLTLLVFGSVSRDVPMLFAAGHASLGLLVWLSLLAVFYQHRQERLEALEAGEMAAARGGSVFDAAGGEPPAARRLRLMHRWLMPGASLVLAAGLGLGAWMMLAWLDGRQLADIDLTPARGWAVAICLSVAMICFIASRFVAGMSRQPAWQNLRGGAGSMVGVALVLLAVGVGLIFRFFDKEQPIVGVVWAIPIFMIAMSAEIAFNFVLNLYRPRLAGETPRPAFDSRVLSLLAAPESIVQSVGEAVNYQFGFDITSSWGYKLLLRSFGWLVAFGAAVLLVLNMMVVVEPDQQGVITSGAITGTPVQTVHSTGITWKLPWPLQSAEVYDVSRVRQMGLTAQRRLRAGEPDLWDVEIRTDTTLDPFLVGSSLMRVEAPPEGGTDPGEQATSVSDLFALIEAEITLQYRIRTDGLLDYLAFATDDARRRQPQAMRVEALRALALREITQHLSQASLEEVVAAGQGKVVSEMERRIQAAFDRQRTGIEVLRLNVPMLRPAGQVAREWEDLAMARQDRLETVAQAESKVIGDLVRFVGDPAMSGRIVEAVERYRALRNDRGDEGAAATAQRQEVEALLSEAGGQLAQMIGAAEARRWITIMQARAQARQFEGQLAAYEEAPELFRQREIMRVVRRALPTRRKYVLVGIDPHAVNLDVILEEASSLFSISPQDESGESKP